MVDVLLDGMVVGKDSEFGHVERWVLVEDLVDGGGRALALDLECVLLEVCVAFLLVQDYLEVLQDCLCLVLLLVENYAEVVVHVEGF